LQIIHFEELDSTNFEARRRAEVGHIGPLWITAARQSAGRGRRGREWTSELGNLYCTGLYPNFGDLKQAAQMSFVAALAVADTIIAYVAPNLVSLKWPNDVLIDGAKAAGILLENGTSQGGAWFAVGIGINLVSHPSGTPYRATHVLEYIASEKLECSEPVMTGPEAACALLAARFDHWRHVLMTEGFAPIREAWMARAKGIGETVTVQLPNDTFFGTALGLGADGELQVKLDNGTIRDVHAGDVFFGEQD